MECGGRAHLCQVVERVGRHLERENRNDALDVCRVDRELGLAQHPHVFADPGDEDELFARRLDVVGVLDADVGERGVALFELAHELVEAAGARCRQDELVAPVACIVEQEPRLVVLVAANGIVRVLDLGSRDVGLR